MKKKLLIIALGIFILTSAIAIAGDNETDLISMGSTNFSDRVVQILNHNSDPEEGNWITMGIPSEEREIQLPKQIKLKYSGPKYAEYGVASGSLSRDGNGSYTVNYPSTSSYLNYPVYLPGDNISMSFHGDSGLGGDVGIYLFKLDPGSLYEIFEAFTAGETGDLASLFHNNIDGNYKKYSASLGENGDLLNYNFGPLEAGQYCTVMLQANEDGSLKALSATPFVVTDYQLDVSAPERIDEGDDMDICSTLEGAPREVDCIYGALLISDEAYKADIGINSDGTKNGTSLMVNDIDLIDEFDINPSNYMSGIDRETIQKNIQSLIGEGKGALAIGQMGQEELSLTAFDLPKGDYYLFVGAYSPEKGLLGLAQKEIEIESKGSSHGGGNSGGNNNGGGSSSGGNNSGGGSSSGGNNSGGGSSSGGNNNGGSSGTSGNSGSGSSSGTGGSPESAKNIKSKELCQQFISNGKVVRFEFTKGATCVNYVVFEAKKTAGKTTAIVEELKGKSVLTPNEPAGEIYKHINIWIGNDGFANSKNIGNASVGFRVNKNWINENNIKLNSLALQHFNNKKWNSLPTKQIDEDDEYIYFEAKTPSFSPFAITAEKNTVVIEDKEGENKGSDLASQEEKTETYENSNASKDDGNKTIPKIVTFFIGLLVILIIGAIIIKKKGPEQ